jgi:hypothetical protein
VKLVYRIYLAVYEKSLNLVLWTKLGPYLGFIGT